MKNTVKNAVNMITNSDTDLSKLFDKDGLLKQLTKALVEKALQEELKDHLGHAKYEHVSSSNYRNGTINKKLLTDSS